MIVKRSAKERGLVSLLEFMGGSLKCDEIANPIITGRAAKNTRGCNRHQHRVATRASSGHENRLCVGKPLLCESGCADGIFNIGDAPLALQPVAVAPPIAGAA